MTITKEQINILKQFEELGIIDNFKEVIRVLLIVKNAKDYNTCLEQFNTFKISNIYENTDNFKYFKDWEQLFFDVGMIDNFCFDKSKCCHKDCSTSSIKRARARTTLATGWLSDASFSQSRKSPKYFL